MSDTKIFFTGDTLPEWCKQSHLNYIAKKLISDIGADKKITIDVCCDSVNDSVTFYASRYSALKSYTIKKEIVGVSIK